MARGMKRPSRPKAKNQPFGGLGTKKLKKILTHGRLQGHRLTQKQRGAIGARLGEQGSSPRRKR